MNATNKPVPAHLRRVVHWRTMGFPERVRHGLDQNGDARSDAYARKEAGELDQVAYCRRMGELFDREARWWALLEGWVYSSRAGGISTVFGKATIAARTRARAGAEEYRGHERFWMDRRPVSERAA